MWTMPYGLYVLGSTDGDRRRNAMTINWVTQVSFDPKLIGVGIESTAYTHELVEAGGCFSLCIIDREDRAIVRKFTKPVEVDLDARTLNGFEYTEAVTGAPVLAQSVAYLDCRVTQRVAGGGARLLHRRGGRRCVLQGRGHPGAAHGGHPDELRRLSSRPGFDRARRVL